MAGGRMDRSGIRIAITLPLVAALLLAGCHEPELAVDRDPAGHYLLGADEVPAGLQICEPSDEMRAMGVLENPGRAPPFLFYEIAEEAEDLGVPLPTSGWFQVLTPEGTPTCDFDAGDGALILLVAWESAAALDEFIQAHLHDEYCVEDNGMQECMAELALCDDEPIVLFEDRYILFVPEFGPEGTVISALRAKHPGMSGLCY